MPSFKLTNKAKSDLLSIGRYTKKEWGIAQRNSYLKEIDEMFNLLGDNPEMGKHCDYIHEGYLKFYIGKHVIFYRINNHIIEIVRILHESMDHNKHI
jgi:toxin ParE1/3/4